MAADALGPRLRTLREQAGLTQRDVAAELDTAEVTISRWESGSHLPQLRNLRKLARLYGVTLAHLQGKTEPGSLTASEARTAIEQVRTLLEEHPELAEELLRDLRNNR